VTHRRDDSDKDVLWLEDRAVRSALLVIAGGIAGFCASARIAIPYTAHEIVGMLAGIAATIGGSAYLYRRIRAGLRHDSDAKRVTFTKPDE
jgi:hypothetical protein